jgi:hypothetical protein
MHVEKYHSHTGSIGINGTVGVIRTRVPTTSQLIQQGVAHEVLATFSGEGVHTGSIALLMNIRWAIPTHGGAGHPRSKAAQ